VATEADGITPDMVITELSRRDVPVIRFNPAGIGEDLAVSAGGSLRDGGWGCLQGRPRRDTHGNPY